MRNLTPEQELVVAHPLGCHARVLAVAGSGKSTTLAHHIHHLIQSKQAPPNAMLVLMFNALARQQFVNHLDQVGVPSNLQPAVHTFHSFSYRVIHEAIKDSLLPSNTQFWLSDKAEYIWVCLKRVIGDLEKAKRFPPESVDPEQAMHAISLWKGSLIPPNRAGSFMQPYLPIVYAGFEEFRQSQNALTNDDFIPTAIDILEKNPPLLWGTYGRLPVIALKTAMILAAFDWESGPAPVVQLPHFIRAITFCESWRSSAHRTLLHSKNLQNTGLGARIQNCTSISGQEGITLRDLLRSFSNIPKTSLQKNIDKLVADGELEPIKISSGEKGGRPTVKYHLSRG